MYPHSKTKLSVMLVPKSFANKMIILLVKYFVKTVKLKRLGIQ